MRSSHTICASGIDFYHRILINVIDIWFCKVVRMIS